MQISGIRHDWPEKARFIISRPIGHEEYTFLHFSTPVDFVIGEKTVSADAGACIFYAPGVPQQFFSADHGIIHNWFHASYELGGLLDRYSIPQNRLIYPGTTEFISEIFRKAEFEFFSDNPHKQALIETYINEFVIKFSRAVSGSQSAVNLSRKDAEKLRSVRRQVLSSPERGWTVEQMASEAALSTSRFHTVYKALFGTSPVQDVIHARIDYSKSLILSDERLTLPDIAEKAGYNDQYHFIRQFKAVTGTTPGAYRKGSR